MNFYRRRPLAAAISLCIAVSAAAAFLGAVPKLILIAAVILAAIVAVLIFSRRKASRICNLTPTAFVLLTSALTLCMLLTSFAYFNVYAAKYERLTVGVIRAEIINVESRTAYNAVYKVRLQSLRGVPDSAVGVIYSETSETLTVGDVIVSAVKFSPLEKFYDYRDVSRLMMLADGNVFACDTVGSVIAAGTEDSLEIRLSKLRDLYSAKMALYLDSDSSALADALFLGDREGLGRIYRDFNYAGVLHILALSGLHLSVMSGGLERLFIKLRLGRRIRCVLLLGVIFFYIALTGFLMSVIRAAAMLMITYAASSIDSESDRVTALFAAVWLIAFVSPASLFDVSLQLSFCATLGMVLMGGAADRKAEAVKAKHKSKSRILPKLYRILGSIGASLGAILFVLPLQWLYFREISTMSVPATLIMSLLCEGLLLLLLPYIVCSLMGLHFVCGRLAYPIAVLTRLCESAADKLAERSVLISLQYPFALPIIICLSCVIIWMMIKNFKSWLYALIPFAAAITVFLGAVGLYRHSQVGVNALDYVTYKNHDAMLTVSHCRAMVIDITDGSGVLMWDVRERLAERYFTEVDTLMLTDIDRRHMNAVYQFLRWRRVGRVVIPIPGEDYDAYMLDAICAAAEEYGAETVLYSPYRETTLDFGDLELFLPSRKYLSRSAEPLLLISFLHGTHKLTYAGSSSWENEYMWSFSKDASHMILGSNGPIFKSPPVGTVPRGLESIVISPRLPFDGLTEWLCGFSGTVYSDDSVSITFPPLNP